nr:D-arabinitol dehydrogenase 1-like [Leptinotarsa decemlineata]
MVHKLPDIITLQQGALAEPLSCISHGWDIISPVSVGSRVLIVGAGIIGILWASLFHSQRHRHVTVCEPNEARRAILENLNTGFTLLKPEELESKRKDQHYLFDVIIDCSGYAQAIEHAISFLQRGGKICCFGVAPPDATIRVKPFDIFMNELKIYGVKVNPFSFPKALGLLESMGDRYLNYDCLGIKIFELKDYKVALDQLRKGIILKAMFKF